MRKASSWLPRLKKDQMQPSTSKERQDAGPTRERWGGVYMWQASELAFAVVLGAGAGDASGCEFRAESGSAIGGAGGQTGDDAVADVAGDATGRGARFTFASAELTEGSVSEFSVGHATRDFFGGPQDSSVL